jgi:arylsulfatase A-like enzyme
MDLALVILAGSVSYAVLANTTGPARRWVRAGVHSVAGLLALFYLLELAVLRSLGVPGLYYPLMDFLSNAAGIAPLLAGELTSGGWVLFAAPVAIACAPLLARAPDDTGIEAANGAWLLLPSVALLVALPLGAGVSHVQSAAGRFAVSAWDGLRVAPEVPYAPPFDATGLALESTTTATTDRPNVIVILLESVRARSTTPYNPGLTTTPFLDSLARTGMLVERMYAPASYTNKAIVSAFSGIPPSPEAVVEQAEAFPNGLPGVGLPRLLTAEGDRTAFITPAEMEFERKDRILDNLGFSEHFGDGDFPTAGFTQKAYFGFEDRIVFDHTVAWIDSARAGGRPFFLGMLTLSAHHPYDLPESHASHAHATGDESLDAYLNAITYTDRFVRDLHAALDSRGLLSNTLFVVLGDHGEAFAEHGAKTHGDVIWDEALHVPAILAGPGIEPGTRAGGLRTTGDIVPTIAELLGYRLVGGELPAQSLLRPVPADRTLYHSAKNGRVALALRRGTLKYIYWGGRQPMQVFDTSRDPLEREDISSTRRPGELRAVEAELLAWRAGVVGAYRSARSSAVRTPGAGIR